MRWLGPKIIAPLTTQDRGRWIACDTGTYITCPDCGALYVLGNDFVITQGWVFPTVRCTAKGCEFSESIMLEGWAHGEVGTA